jgi:vacuolar-type H+-ATPase subunit I/STV1
MSLRTVFLCKLYGLFAMIFSLATASHLQASRDLFDELCHRPLALLLFGLIGLAAGLAMVLGHSIWSGGLRTCVVTLLGWLVLLKSILLLMLPARILAELYQNAWTGVAPGVYLAVCFALGAYLAWGGFRPPPRVGGNGAR